MDSTTPFWQQLRQKDTASEICGDIKLHLPQANSSLGRYATSLVLQSTSRTLSNSGRSTPHDSLAKLGIRRDATMPLLRLQAGGANSSADATISPLHGSISRLRYASEKVEEAIKNQRIFTLQGPYPAIRESLRKRGWVEKFYQPAVTSTLGPATLATATTGKKTKKSSQKSNSCSDPDAISSSDYDDDYDDDNGVKADDYGSSVAPWEEENGIFGMMSRNIRNACPSFIWTVRRDAVDVKTLKKEQMFNHYGKAGAFTTKVGLCMNMRNLPWVDDADPDAFFPRCYRLSNEEEKQAFIDDYRLTACVNLLKLASRKHRAGLEAKRAKLKATLANISSLFVPQVGHPLSTEKVVDPSDDPAKVTTSGGCVKEELGPSRNSSESSSEAKSSHETVTGVAESTVGTAVSDRNAEQKVRDVIPLDALEFAMDQCQRYLNFVQHRDIDSATERSHDSCSWNDFISLYYKILSNEINVCAGLEDIVERVETILEDMKTLRPQSELDDVKNVWIVKPGAKSRGRGVVCYNNLEEILKLVSTQVVQKDGKYIVQKYIERPLLIYETKFDIRQWFLVTDWNPLTVWMYQKSYLRFCSQPFTLDDFNEAIHLSNNSIQKNYENSTRRPVELPRDNMWSSEQFLEYLRLRGQSATWIQSIYPGMKRAIVCALLCSQDTVEHKKSEFELYGADFMLTEDMNPWLIEINSSPCMAPSTRVTARLCQCVLEDTLKVVLDRKLDKCCEIGDFELAYKQAYVTVPPYIGINLSVEGQALRKPYIIAPFQPSLASPSRLSLSRSLNNSSMSFPAVERAEIGLVENIEFIRPSDGINVPQPRLKKTLTPTQYDSAKASLRFVKIHNQGPQVVTSPIFSTAERYLASRQRAMVVTGSGEKAFDKRSKDSGGSGNGRSSGSSMNLGGYRVKRGLGKEPTLVGTDQQSFQKISTNVGVPQGTVLSGVNFDEKTMTAESEKDDDAEEKKYKNKKNGASHQRNTAARRNNGGLGSLIGIANLIEEEDYQQIVAEEDANGKLGSNLIGKIGTEKGSDILGLVTTEELIRLDEFGKEEEKEEGEEEERDKSTNNCCSGNVEGRTKVRGPRLSKSPIQNGRRLRVFRRGNDVIVTSSFPRSSVGDESSTSERKWAGPEPEQQRLIGQRRQPIGKQQEQQQWKLSRRENGGGVPMLSIRTVQIPLTLGLLPFSTVVANHNQQQQLSITGSQPITPALPQRVKSPPLTTSELLTAMTSERAREADLSSSAGSKSNNLVAPACLVYGRARGGVGGGNGERKGTSHQKKVFLRYTDGGIPKPSQLFGGEEAHMLGGAFSKLVARYMSEPQTCPFSNECGAQPPAASLCGGEEGGGFRQQTKLRIISQPFL